VAESLDARQRRMVSEGIERRLCPRIKTQPLDFPALRRVARASVLLLVFSFFVSCSQPRPLDDARLRSADQEIGNWLLYGRTYDDHRFSPLNQINEQTVAKLGLAWSRELNTTRGLEATPLVEDGVLYATGAWSVVYAIDANTPMAFSPLTGLSVTSGMSNYFGLHFRSRGT
jgi:glucose dehydrogenase